LTSVLAGSEPLFPVSLQVFSQLFSSSDIGSRPVKLHGA
jgi:hypothetical protein